MKRLLLIFLGVGFYATGLRAQAELTASSFQWVNSSFDEQNPVINPDGKSLYITMRNHPQNMDGRRDPGDIWISSWVDNQWTQPVHGGSLINDRSYNAIAGFSADGSQMFLLHHVDPHGTARTQGISVSRKTSGGWSRPENIFIPYFQNKSSFHSGHVLFEAGLFVYSAETYGSNGVDDIYMSKRGGDGKWSEPKNLGPIINTQFQELSPSLSADGMTLYFSSNGRKGLGSFDVYYSTRLDDSFTHWTEPVNAGPGVNSEGRELYYRIYENFGFSLYTSTKNSDGYGDIKFIVTEKPEAPMTRVEQAPQDSVVNVVESPVVEEATNEIRIYGRVLSTRSGNAIEAKLKFDGPEGILVAESTASGYSVSVPRSRVYQVEVEGHGFVSRLERIDLQGVDLKEIELNFNLQPIEIGTTVNLKSVLFRQSTPELLLESYPELDQVVAFMKANPNLEIELAGHTDSRGSYRQLLALSQKRVNRVKEYMVSKGIDKKRITGKGYGGSKPVAGNDTEESRALNRRVEFIIKKF